MQKTEVVSRPFLSPRIRLWIWSLVLSCLIAFFFLIPSNPGVYRAVPSQTALLIELNGPGRAALEIDRLKEAPWRRMLKSGPFERAWQDIGNLAPLFESDDGLKRAVSENKCLATWSFQPVDSMCPLLILDAGSGFDLAAQWKRLGESVRSFPYQFHGQTLFTVHIGKGPRYVIAQKGRLLIFSRYSYLVEDALSQWEGARGWWSGNKYLSDLDSKAPLRLFFRPDKWKNQQQGNLFESARPLSDLIRDNVDWIGLSIHDGQVRSICVPNGFLAKIGSWNGAARQDIASFIPENAAIVALAGFDNRKRFFSEWASGDPGDFSHFMLPWIGNQIALIVTEPLSNGLSDDRLLLFQVSDATEATASLRAYGESRGLISSEQENMFDLFCFQDNALLRPFFDADDPAFRHPCVAVLGAYAVAAPNRAALETYLAKYVNNQTLAQHADFLQVMQKIHTTGRAVVMLHGGYLPKLATHIFKENSSDFFRSGALQNLSETGWFATELTPGAGRTMELELFSQKAEGPLPESGILWKTTLDAMAVTPVSKVLQPDMKTGAAFLVQDRNTRLYCLDGEGVIRWQKQLGSFVNSPISGIDVYQNGRNCFVFSTLTHLWMLDENGSPVQGFPVTLKASSSVGLTVVRFDKGLDLAFFVGCENGNTYGFDLYGRALEGWNPQPTVGNLLHFQQNGRDFLAILGRTGLLQVFGRDGKPRFEKIKLDGRFSSGAIYVPSAQRGRIICVNDQGAVSEIEPGGQVRSYQLGGVNGTGKFRQISADGHSPRYAWLSGKTLRLYDRNQGAFQILAVQNLVVSADDLFDAGQNRTGLFSISGRRIFLLDNQGKFAAGFPLSGTTGFAIHVVGNQEILIAGNDRSVYAYQL